MEKFNKKMTDPMLSPSDGGGGTVIITSAPGPGLCHSQRFSEIL